MLEATFVGLEKKKSVRIGLHFMCCLYFAVLNFVFIISLILHVTTL